jgi:hypothetical protein
MPIGNPKSMQAWDGVKYLGQLKFSAEVVCTENLRGWLNPSQSAMPPPLGHVAIPKKQTFSSIDRLIFVCLYRLLPGVRDALAIVKPETVVKWHRAGFRLYWRWKSKARGGRPAVPLQIRKLIREMSIANPLWGAPRIHGELLKLGVDIGQTSVAKYMVSGDETCRPKAGGHSSATTLMESLRWICSSCRQSRFACSMDC